VRAEDRADLLFLYAAGALEGNEREEIETWIEAGVPDAPAQLAQAEREVAHLAAAQRPVTPGAAVWQRVAARVEADRRLRTAGASRPRRRLHPALAASIGALLAAGVAGIAMHRLVSQDLARDAALRSELDSIRGEITSVQAERDALDAELADAEARLRALETDLVLADKTIGVLHADGMESLALNGTAAAPDARGRAYWDWDAWYCYLRVSGLPKDPEKIYAIWLFTDDDVVGVGTFHADAQGLATFLGPVPHVGHVLRAGISIEPDEDLGSKPRGEVVLVGAADPSKKRG